MKILGKRSGSAQFSTASAKLRLIGLLALFTTALLIPLAFLANHVYDQFDKEMYLDYKWNAERLTKLANKAINKMLYKEEVRPFGDYQYFKWIANPLTHHKEKTISPLADPAKIEHIPGFVGHFQIDAEDRFSSPILPYIEEKYLSSKLNLAWEEMSKRMATQEQVKSLLIANEFLKPPEHIAMLENKPLDSDKHGDKTTEQHKQQQLYAQQLKTEKMKAEQLDKHKQPKDDEFKEVKKRQEEASISKDASKDQWKPTQMPASESDYMSVMVEIDPFQWKRSSDGFYIFYRKAWRQSKRYIQGFIVNENELLEHIVLPLLAERKFETQVALQLYQDETLLKHFDFIPNKGHAPNVVMRSDHIEPSKDKGFHFESLRKPLEPLGFYFTTSKWPRGPGARFVSLLLIVVSAVIAVGIYILYRAGYKQILLSEERLNFVSAVSHELKTPLTSILMYSEMLKEGMVRDSEKRKSYYDFIFFESERLSRLIANVLQLSRLGKDSQAMDIEYCSINRLRDLVRSKVSTLLEKNQFTLNFQVTDLDESGLDVLVDQDSFSQIAINLIDNAIKFTIDKDQPEKVIRQLDVGFKPANVKDMVVFYVRDYGPGVAASQNQKIFELFYRVGDELTRTKPGTGIGLALVSELASAMNGRVEVLNRQPGAEFCVTLPAKGR